jgi:uncharacterized protein YneF (UPF0154 family)
MIKNVLSEMGGVGLYGVISICLFFTVFLGAILWTFIQRKSLMDAMGALPLADDRVLTSNQGETRHE